MIQLLFGIGMFFYSSPSNAVEFSVEFNGQGTSLPAVELSTNGEIIVDFMDGRRATLSRPSQTRIVDFNLDAEIVENTCVNNFKRVKCSYYVNLVDERLVNSWISHPEKEKIGRVLIDNRYDESNPSLDFFNIWMWEYKNLNYSLEVFPINGLTPWSNSFQKMLKNPVLVCDDMSWTSATFGHNNGNIKIDEWTAESNEQNPETKLNENLMTRTYLDVDGKINKNAIEFTGYGFTPQVSEDAAVSGFSLGDVIGWSFIKGNKSCEVSLKIDRAALLAGLIEILTISKELDLKPVVGIKNLDVLSAFQNNDDYPSLLEYKDLIIKAKGKAFYETVLTLTTLDLIESYISTTTTNNNIVTNAKLVIEMGEIE